jgi:hypothetical protein
VGFGIYIWERLVPLLILSTERLESTELNRIEPRRERRERRERRREEEMSVSSGEELVGEDVFVCGRWHEMPYGISAGSGEWTHVNGKGKDSRRERKRKWMYEKEVKKLSGHDMGDDELRASIWKEVCEKERYLNEKHRLSERKKNSDVMRKYRRDEKEYEKYFVREEMRSGKYNVKTESSLRGFKYSKEDKKDMESMLEAKHRIRWNLVPLEGELMRSRLVKGQVWKPEVATKRVYDKDGVVKKSVRVGLHGQSKIERNAESGKLKVKKFEMGFVRSVVMSRLKLGLSQQEAAMLVMVRESLYKSFEKGNELYDVALKSMLNWKLVMKASKM